MTWALENKLVSKFKFVVVRRAGREWVEVEKSYIPKKREKSSLFEEKSNYLIKRCNHIVNCFENPEANRKTIRKRLHNLAQTLPYREALFVHNWKDRYYKDD
jgi:hypothetical protein